MQKYRIRWTITESMATRDDAAPVLPYAVVEQTKNLTIIQPTPTTELVKANGIRFCEYGSSDGNTADIRKVVLVVGATGAGKTTLINAMTNYLLKVKWDSNIRYKLVVEQGSTDQSKSQTSETTVYTFYPSCKTSLNYPISIIDTPGFGDTRGKDMDRQITDQIRNLFAVTGPNAIDHIHGIIFVVQSSLSRLTESQEYIFNSVLELFAKDVEKQIFLAATFCDDKRNIPAVAALKASSVPYQTTLPFNNSALYYSMPSEPTTRTSESSDESDDEEVYDPKQGYWKMGEKTFKKLFKCLESVKAVSSSQTRRVLNERRELELIMQKLPNHIKKVLAKIDEMEKDKKALKQLSSKVEESKDFTYTVTVTKKRKVEVTGGRKVTTCKICEYTCDDNCSCSTGWKYWCYCMTFSGTCKFCPKHCSYSDHVDDGYIYEQYQEEEKRTKEDLQKKYQDAVSNEEQKKAQIGKMEKEIKQLNSEAIQSLRKAFHCEERLAEIALRPKTTSVSAYIERLIEKESKEQQVGWQRRVEYFRRLPDNPATMAELQKEKEEDSWFQKMLTAAGNQTEKVLDEIEQQLTQYLDLD